MRVRYFLLSIISVFLLAVFAVATFTVYRSGTDVISRDGSLSVAASSSDSYILKNGDTEITIELLPSSDSIMANTVIPEVLKADIGIYSYIRDIYIDLLKNFGEKA